MRIRNKVRNLARNPFRNSIIAGLFFLGLAGAPAQAGVAIGTGFSSLTSGRQVPLLSAAWLGTNWDFTLISTGVSSNLYYQSGWILSGYRSAEFGHFGLGAIRAGLGIGVYGGERGYRETPAAELERAQDFTMGPAFRVSWHFLGPAFVAIEGLFGMRQPLNLVLLSAQDITHLVVGVEF